MVSLPEALPYQRLAHPKLVTARESKDVREARGQYRRAKSRLHALLRKGPGGGDRDSLAQRLLHERDEAAAHVTSLISAVNAATHERVAQEPRPGRGCIVQHARRIVNHFHQATDGAAALGSVVVQEVRAPSRKRPAPQSESD